MKNAEHKEQAALIEYAELMSRKDPRWGLLFSIPNGGLRNIITARRMKKEGQKAGVPDLCLPVPCGNWHGLFIELKTATGKATEAQKAWIAALTEQGYMARVCRGWSEARELITNYLSGKT